MRQFVLIFITFFFLDHGLAKEAKVLRETPFDYTKDEKGKLVVTKRKYTDYRPLWGKRITIISADHTPVPELLDQDDMPLQVEVSLTRNFSLFSIGAEAGYMKVNWENSDGDSIGMDNFYFGLVGHLDGLFAIPYVVPFFSVGGIVIDAEIGGASIEANDYTLYYRGGFLFSLNWIDKLTSSRAYDDFGLLNSYIYVGVRKWAETNSNQSLNLEIDPSLEFGLQLEF